APATVEARLGALSGEGLTGAIVMRDAAGAVVVRLDGVHVRRVARERLAPAVSPLLDLVWEEAASATQDAPPAGGAAVGDGPHAAVLRRRLAAEGVRIHGAAFEPTSADADVGVLDLRALDLAEEARSPLDALVGATSPALDLLRRADGRRVVVVTRGAHAVHAHERPDPRAAAVDGLAAGAAAEAAPGRVRRVALDPALAVDHSAPAPAATLASPDALVALRAGRRHVPRLARVEAATGPRRVEVAERGSLASVRIVALARRKPAEGDVEIAVRAAALSFRDVLGALARLPGPVAPLGLECAGVVEEVGPGVAHLRRGDHVLALAPGSLATHVTCPAG